MEIDLDTPVVSNSKKRKGDDAGSGDDEEEDGMLPTGLKGFKQRDLVAEAFAGDNVVQVRLRFNHTVPCRRKVLTM